MFNRKWGKAPPLLSNYHERCNWSVLLPHVQMGRFVDGSHFLLWGIFLLLSGCALDVTSGGMGIGPLKQIMPDIPASPPSIIKISSDLSPATSISPLESTNEEKFSGKNTRQSGQSQSQHHAPVVSEQKPTILVPENPNKDNGQVVVIYKSTIEETQHLMRNVNESQLTKEQHDTYISIHSFLEKSQEAFLQHDMSMAVNLAEKAHTLAKEIVKNSTKP